MADYGNLIDLTSHPSKLIIRPVAELSKRHSNVKFYKIEFEELSDVGNELDSPLLPTFLLYKNGEVVADVITVKSHGLQEKIKAFIEKVNYQFTKLCI
ncbi:thioredoxin domain-containing protein [Penicillium canescens]|uniref:Thioredoxin domain-containing protein n=1 Tax=Penicillium canescens TaxID=5083 RepID=A0AAD6N8T6_PENCN|nr:thioredoxin domain-containing protein [Penicillium canescens]KAJ5998069.1 thioredoxin domain-containing protein [Penicillium canescens]KAJ6043121.1 thioredoxin domain-containing protein [Penicillium canescens]KAJ6054597.1 thioredoxin domain-containing protein [Penicillium canescens]KAJ6073540.1 thioredoxin domain-containing protein [Penicillium canescens]KAJ6080677.1 thioredoxin domain-containing protein [Penicillium canescens]